MKKRPFIVGFFGDNGGFLTWVDYAEISQNSNKKEHFYKGLYDNGWGWINDGTIRAFNIKNAQLSREIVEYGSKEDEER